MIALGSCHSGGKIIMKILNLLRHAKSSWADATQSDIDRPLNGRGLKACVTMAPAIEQAECSFDYIVASPACRAQQTIEGIGNVLGVDDWHTETELYTFDSRQLQQCVAQLADSFDEALLVGHNPAITEFCNHRSNARIDNVPTCGYARIEFEMDSWRDIEKTAGAMTVFLTPKLVKA